MINLLNKNAAAKVFTMLKQMTHILHLLEQVSSHVLQQLLTPEPCSALACWIIRSQVDIAGVMHLSSDHSYSEMICTRCGLMLLGEWTQMSHWRTACSADILCHRVISHSTFIMKRKCYYFKWIKLYLILRVVHSSVPLCLSSLSVRPSRVSTHWTDLSVIVGLVKNYNTCLHT